MTTTVKFDYAGRATNEAELSVDTYQALRAAGLDGWLLDAEEFTAYGAQARVQLADGRRGLLWISCLPGSLSSFTSSESAADPEIASRVGTLAVPVIADSPALRLRDDAR